MLRLLERDPHGHRLHDLLARFRGHEVALTGALEDTQDRLEQTHREASRARCHGAGADCALLLGIELQRECDALAVELVHVRMAIAGTSEELRDHDERRFASAQSPLSTPA
jgi:hypothetical protein